MKKILFVVDERQMGGVNILLEDYLKNIDRTNKNITVLILHNNGDRLYNLPEDIEVMCINKELDIVDISLNELVRKKKFFKAIKKILFSICIKTGYIKRIIKKIRNKYNIKDYDIEVAFKDGFCQLFTVYGDSKKKISWLHNDYSRNNFISKYEKTFKRVHKQLDCIIAISSEIKENFCKLYNNEDKVIIINNYIDENKIKKMAKEECNLEINKKKVNLLGIGRLSYEKGYDRVILALKKLGEEYEDLEAKLTINVIGDGEERASLETMSKEYGLENIINFLGRDNNPYKYIQKHDMVLIPSRYEAYCIVMIEALINKVPLLTTEVASVKEITHDGEYGIITKNSEEGIYNSLKQLIDNKAIITKYKENVSEYSYTNKNKSIISAVDKLLEIG